MLLPLPLANLSGILDTPLAAPVWNWIASALGSAAVYAQRKATPGVDEYEELALRLRKPLTWTSRHPVQAAVRLKRKIDTRQQ